MDNFQQLILITPLPTNFKLFLLANPNSNIILMKKTKSINHSWILEKNFLNHFSANTTFQKKNQNSIFVATKIQVNTEKSFI